MEQLIELVRGKVKTRFDSKIVSDAGQIDLKGNWLIEPADLQRAINFCNTIVQDIHQNNPGLLKHSPYKVSTTSTSVSIEHHEIVK